MSDSKSSRRARRVPPSPHTTGNFTVICKTARLPALHLSLSYLEGSRPYVVGLPDRSCGLRTRTPARPARTLYPGNKDQSGKSKSPRRGRPYIYMIYLTHFFSCVVHKHARVCTRVPARVIPFMQCAQTSRSCSRRAVATDPRASAGPSPIQIPDRALMPTCWLLAWAECSVHAAASGLGWRNFMMETRPSATAGGAQTYPAASSADTPKEPV